MLYSSVTRVFQGLSVVAIFLDILAHKVLSRLLLGIQSSGV